MIQSLTRWHEMVAARDLSAAEVLQLNPVAPKGYLIENPAKGIF